MEEMLSAEHPAPVAVAVAARRKRRRKKKPVEYATVAVNNFRNQILIYRVRAKFVDEFVDWLNSTRGHCAFRSAYTPEPFYPLLPKCVVQSFLAHRLL